MHKGHAYLIRQARQSYGADRVILIMSGDFLQRGAPACIDKYARCRMALQSGADMVLELPSPGALASAEGFASSAVSVLDSLGIADLLCFGCEDANLQMLLTIAAALNEEAGPFKKALDLALRQGNSFPAARQAALAALFPDHPQLTDILKKPNNILAVEYCRALLKLHSPICPAPVQRLGQYHSLSTEGEMLSASAIRRVIAQAQKTCPERAFARQSAFPGSPDHTQTLPDEVRTVLDRAMPAPAAALLKEQLCRGGILDADDFSDMIIYALYRERGRLDTYSDVSSDLAARLETALYTSSDLRDLIDRCTARTWTQTRIRRCLFHILLGHTKELWDFWKADGFHGYVNVLGFHTAAADLLKAIPEAARKQLILRSADRKALQGTASRISDSDLLASELWRSVYARTYHSHRRSVLQEPVCVIDQEY